MRGITSTAWSSLIREARKTNLPPVKKLSFEDALQIPPQRSEFKSGVDAFLSSPHIQLKDIPSRANLGLPEAGTPPPNVVSALNTAELPPEIHREGTIMLDPHKYGKPRRGDRGVADFLMSPNEITEHSRIGKYNKILEEAVELLTERPFSKTHEKKGRPYNSPDEFTYSAGLIKGGELKVDRKRPLPTGGIVVEDVSNWANQMREYAMDNSYFHTIRRGYSSSEYVDKEGNLREAAVNINPITRWLFLEATQNDTGPNPLRPQEMEQINLHRINNKIAKGQFIHVRDIAEELKPLITSATEGGSNKEASEIARATIEILKDYGEYIKKHLNEQASNPNYTAEVDANHVQLLLDLRNIYLLLKSEHGKIGYSTYKDDNGVVQGKYENPLSELAYRLAKWAKDNPNSEKLAEQRKVFREYLCAYADKRYHELLKRELSGFGGSYNPVKDVVNSLDTELWKISGKLNVPYFFAWKD